MWQLVMNFYKRPWKFVEIMRTKQIINCIAIWSHLFFNELHGEIGIILKANAFLINSCRLNL